MVLAPHFGSTKTKAVVWFGLVWFGCGGTKTKATKTKAVVWFDLVWFGLVVVEPQPNHSSTLGFGSGPVQSRQCTRLSHDAAANGDRGGGGGSSVASSRRRHAA